MVCCYKYYNHSKQKFKLNDKQPIDTMKAGYCVVVWSVNLSEQTLVDLSLSGQMTNVLPL